MLLNKETKPLHYGDSFWMNELKWNLVAMKDSLHKDKYTYLPTPPLG